jgi:putative transposase
MNGWTPRVYQYSRDTRGKISRGQRHLRRSRCHSTPTLQPCKDADLTEQTYYRWRKEYGGLKLDQARRLKELDKENARLKRVVADLPLEKQVLRDVAQGNF